MTHRICTQTARSTHSPKSGNAVKCPAFTKQHTILVAIKRKTATNSTQQYSTATKTFAKQAPVRPSTLFLYPGTLFPRTNFRVEHFAPEEQKSTRVHFLAGHRPTGSQCPRPAMVNLGALKKFVSPTKVDGSFTLHHDTRSQTHPQF